MRLKDAFGDTAAMRVNQLWPQPGEVEIDSHVAALGLAGQAGEDLPHTVANFVASLDGRAGFEGRSGPLGDEGDRALFHALRETADAVMAGTGTLTVERYGRLIRSPEARERRARAGRSAEPLACIVTRSGRLPLEIPLFAEPEARIVVLSGAPVQAQGVAAQVEVVALEEPTLAAALHVLRTRYEVRCLLCEGGPTILGALIRERLLDELFLTVAPKLAGGGHDPALSTGPILPEPATAELAGVLERQGSLFLRYRTNCDA
jgi:riboflavin biosynthesis pyrimidine reductase